MAKRNKKRRSRLRARQKPIPPQGKWRSLLRKLSSPTGIVLTSVSFVIAVVCAYFQFKPKVSLGAETPSKSDSGSIISTPFRVTNESVFPIYNVQQIWMVEKQRFYTIDGEETGSYLVEPIQGEPWQPSGTPIPILHSWQSATLYPFENVRVRQVTAKHLKLVASIIYQIPIFHRTRQQDFYFDGDMGADGSFHWYYTSVPERD